MTNVNSLDVETRCWGLVGKFLQNWLAMEQVMRLAMEKVLELDQFQAAIIASNTPLRAKINILRTLVSQAPTTPVRRRQNQTIQRRARKDREGLLEA